jgi:glycosyltransferase involved in cell wall biosynthesis
MGAAMKIFVVTVCRNAKTRLIATIESVNAFRRDDLYYVVVDGNSDDGTKEMLNGAGRQIDRWVSEPDQGIYDAMNKAVSLLPPEDGHVLFLGAGDRLLELPTQEERESGAVLFGGVQIGETPFLSVAGWKLKAGNTLHHQGLFIPRIVLANLRFDTRYELYADFDLNQRLLRAKIPFRALDKIIAFAEPGGVSWRAQKSEMIDIARKNYGIFWGLMARIWAFYHALCMRFLGKDW